MPSVDVIVPIGPGHDQIANEAITSVFMARDCHSGVFTDIQVRAIDDTKAKLGRSKARNMAVQESEADWLFYLDADDLLHPKAFDNFMGGFDAIWGRIVEDREGCMLDRFQIPNIGSFEDLIRYDPYYTIQMGHFIRREVAVKYPFDEEMNTGEDWHYYLRVWKAQKCAKIDKPFMVNRRGRHSTGPRAATGRDWMASVHAQIEKARNEDTGNR